MFNSIKNIVTDFGGKTQEFRTHDHHNSNFVSIQSIITKPQRLMRQTMPSSPSGKSS